MRYICLGYRGSVTFQLRRRWRSYHGLTGWIEGFEPEPSPHDQVRTRLRLLPLTTILPATAHDPYLCLLSSLRSGPETLSRTSFECGLGELRSVRIVAQDDDAVQLTRLVVRYNNQQYDADFSDEAGAWISNDVARGAQSVRPTLFVVRWIE